MPVSTGHNIGASIGDLLDLIDVKCHLGLGDIQHSNLCAHLCFILAVS